MNWFESMFRNLGLMVHNVRHPEVPPRVRVTVSKTVQEATSGEITLRRTTIDEVELPKAKP